MPVWKPASAAFSPWLHRRSPASQGRRHPSHTASITSVGELRAEYLARFDFADAPTLATGSFTLSIATHRDAVSYSFRTLLNLCDKSVTHNARHYGVKCALDYGGNNVDGICMGLIDHVCAYDMAV